MVWSKEAAERLKNAKWPLDENGNRIYGRAPMAIIKGTEAFKSPIDGSVITNSSELKDHMKKHDVVDSREFTPEFYAEKAKERERNMTGEADRSDRVDDIQKAIHTLNSKEN